jgi:hypothetical protein
MIPARAWARMRTGSGTKGTRRYDWAMLQVTSDDTLGGGEDGYSVLLARRHRYTGQLSYYRCWTPGPVPPSKLIAIASARWRIEEDHQLSKQLAGLGLAGRDWQQRREQRPLIITGIGGIAARAAATPAAACARRHGRAVWHQGSWW